MPESRIAFLRGINVGKARRIAMADLRALLTDRGYRQVRTLLNTGNVVFAPPPRARGDLAAAIQQAIAEELGVTAPVAVLTTTELAEALAVNPLAGLADDAARMLVGVLRQPRDRTRLAPLLRQSWQPEALALGRRVAYLWCAGGIVKSPVGAAVNRVVGDGITSRNWTTMQRVLALARTPGE